MIRLSKHLQQLGLASRRGAETLIFDGKVQVNGVVVLKPETGVDPLKDKIRLSGQEVKGYEEKVYYVLNKPRGTLCTAIGTGQGRSVLEIFEEEGKRLFTVGRLDKETEGLLIVTNDGQFANTVIHPSNNLEKEYLVKTSHEVTHEHLIKMSSGTTVEGTFVKPKSVTKVRKGTVKIILSEGKKREVRIIMENAGLDVLSLTRIRIGGLLLGPLLPGEWREMTENDKKQLIKENA